MRKSLSKKLRFEVLKRDGFQCQYCGASAPDTLLQVDHIKPVAEGGTNEILNLITSCQACNSGKGARELSDSAAVTKQVEQMRELNARREQIEMMVKWREAIDESQDALLEHLEAKWLKHTGYKWTECGKKEIAKLVKKNGFNMVADAIDTVVDVYVKFNGDEANLKTVDVAFNKLAGVIRVAKKLTEKPWLKECYYIRGILRNRVYVNERYVMSLLEDAVKAGCDIDDIKQLACCCRNWTEFCDEVEEMMEEQNANQV